MTDLCDHLMKQLYKRQKPLKTCTYNAKGIDHRHQESHNILYKIQKATAIALQNSQICSPKFATAPALWDLI